MNPALLNKIIGYARQNVLVILITVTLIAFSSAFYFYGQYLDLKNDPEKITQQKTDELIARVGELIVLPKGETPTVATVSDIEKLKGQPFFINAKRGDRVLIYANAKKAILYNPGDNIIVEVAPVDIGDFQK